MGFNSAFIGLNYIFMTFSNNLTLISYILYIDIGVLMLTSALFSVAFIPAHHHKKAW